MSGVFGSAGKQVGGLAKHVAKQVVREPLEVVKNVVSSDEGKSENQGMEMLEQGLQDAQGQQQTSQKTLADDPQAMQKYANLASQRDEIELKRLRNKLHHEFGIPVGVEEGMQKARMEREQKKQQEEQIEEQKKEQEKMILEEQKKQEAEQVIAAKAQTSAEMGIGRKIAG